MDAKTDKWPAYNVERRAVSALKPYKGNARTHSDAQIAQIAASIQEWGWTTPILIDEKGGVIAGHGRLIAAKDLGVVEVPVVIARGWSKAQKQAYVLADNQLALNAGWDEDLLRVEIGALNEMDFDTSLLGFGEDFLANLFADKNAGLTDPDEVPLTPVNPVTVLGDVWVLGRHRVCCGDSTSPDAIDKLMNGERADLLFTSPPYAQQRDYGAAKEKVGDWDALMQGVFSVAPVKPGAQVLVNLGLVHRDNQWAPYWDQWLEWMETAGWRRFGWYVWDQGSGLPGDWNGRLAPSHEFIFHFNREVKRPAKIVAKQASSGPMGSNLRSKDGKNRAPSSISNDPNKIPDSVVRVNRNSAHRTGHPATFPVELARFLHLSFSKQGDVIFEPFCGSGSSTIAAEMEARHCFGMEIDPLYVDVAVKRWQNFTGNLAILEGDGRTFEQVGDERYDPAKDAAASYDAAIEAKRTAKASGRKAAAPAD